MWNLTRKLKSLTSTSNMKSLLVAMTLEYMTQVLAVGHLFCFPSVESFISKFYKIGSHHFAVLKTQVFPKCHIYATDYEIFFSYFKFH